MGNALMIAAGGGGDAITAAALGPALGLTDDLPIVMTYAWDRLIIDPLPGPRSVCDFTGLHNLSANVLEIVPATKPILPAGSTLPRLAEELSARLLLLDPTNGAVGMAGQIAAAATHLEADELVLVDVGGDVLTNGSDLTVRSPLADLLILAACSRVGLPSRVLVAGPGIDGELTASEVLTRIEQLSGVQVHLLQPGDVRGIVHTLDWHPSEASGLLALAAKGVRGIVEIRDAGAHIRLDLDAQAVFALRTSRVIECSPARFLDSTDSLTSAEDVVREITGVSEIDYERRKSERTTATPSHAPTFADLVRIDEILAEAASRGASFVTARRLAELIGVTSWQHLSDLRRLLAAERKRSYEPPVVRTTIPAN